MANHDIIPNLIIGISGGISAGLGIWIIDRIRERYLFNKDEKRLIGFLTENPSDYFLRTTHRIASGVNLSEDRVRYVCSFSEKIKRNSGEKELWRLATENNFNWTEHGAI